MGCDIHFSIEIRSSVKEGDMEKDTDKIRNGKLTFKEYYQKYTNDKIWKAYYIDWFGYINPDNLDEDIYGGYSEKTHFYKFKELGYNYDPDMEYKLGRNYSLFALLGNVRGTNPKCISENRGLPEDVSDAVRHYYEALWRSDAHSASWITLEEFMSFGKAYLDDTIGEYYWLNIIQPLSEIDYPSNIRLVFWFDN